MTPPRDRAPGAGSSVARPPAIDVAAAILAFGGLFGLTQLALGDFVVTGSLPARAPILGVAFIVHVASAVLGVAVRVGRGWLPAVNLAGVSALLYLLALGRLLNVLLGLAYAVAFAILLVHRRWFRTISEA